MEQWHESLETIGLFTLFYIAFKAWCYRAERVERIRRELDVAKFRKGSE